MLLYRELINICLFILCDKANLGGLETLDGLLEGQRCLASDLWLVMVWVIGAGTR